MHNLTKLIREYDESVLNEAQRIIDEEKITILQKNGRGIKASINDKGEDYIVYIEFSDDLSILNTSCSCDANDNQCIHKAAALLYVKQNYLRAINKYKRDNMKDHLLFFDYYEARDYLLKAISNNTIKKNQLKVVLLDNKKFSKDQRAALFSLCFANYLHSGLNSAQFNSLLKPAIEIIDEYLNQNFFTQVELEEIIYNAVTLFDQNDFLSFVSQCLKVKNLSGILQHVLVRLTNAREFCCNLIKEHEKEILKGEVHIEYETLCTALKYYNYADFVSFKVYATILKNAIHERNIKYFDALLFIGFLKYHEIDKVIDDELTLFIQDNHERVIPMFLKALKRLDLDQINSFLVYLIASICEEHELIELKQLIINAINTSKSINTPLLLFAIKEETKYEIIVTNSNYRQICQMIEFAKDDEKQHLTNLIMRRLEANFIDCVHEFETNFEIELLLKTHQEYVQKFLENSLSVQVNRKRRLFYLSLARKYNLLSKVGLHVFEGN